MEVTVSEECSLPSSSLLGLTSRIECTGQGSQIKLAATKSPTWNKLLGFGVVVNACVCLCPHKSKSCWQAIKVADQKQNEMIKTVSEKKHRAQERRKIGRLQTARLKPSTIIKYCTTLLFFLDWIEMNVGYILADTGELSECLCEFGEFCWAEGESLARYADALSALPHVMRNTRGKLNMPGCWWTPGGWTKYKREPRHFQRKYFSPCQEKTF